MREYTKRKKIFKFLYDKNVDIIYLQETHSTIDTEVFWKYQIKGTAYFSHGTNNSRGVIICFKEGLEHTIHDTIIDKEGRYIIMKVEMLGKMFLLTNVYAPNNYQQQVNFWSDLNRIWGNVEDLHECIFLIGGDFNVAVDPKVDRISSSNTSYSQDSRDDLVMLLNDFNLCDIWRFHNPQKKQYSWRKRDCSVQSRLDYWFISYDAQDNVSNVNYVPSIATDHSALILELKFIDVIPGKGYWKFNTSLCQDEKYCTSLREEFELWLKQTNNIVDPRVRWDYLKYQIRRYTQKYSKHKAREHKAERIRLEKQVQTLESKLDMNPEQIRNYQQAKKALEKYYDHVTEGLIVRSKANWIEYGERSNKYFLTLEKQRKGKSTIRKLLKENNIIEDEQQVLQSVKSFYCELYKKQKVNTTDENAKRFLNTGQRKLSEISSTSCEGLLTEDECKKVLMEMHSGKSPGNDGLSREFYMSFWDIVKEPLLTSLNYSYQEGELSTSQKQSVISLIVKPNKDKRLLESYRPISLINVDAKICSKVLANRLIHILDEIIDTDQYAFIRGRAIAEAIRNVHDVFHFLCCEQETGFIASVDFRKAFDSLDHDYMFQCLRSFGFGASFINWVKSTTI